ncbi:MAG: hypothetical protein H7263_07615 [Candidatus Sericytochromatia bacterium]|nr:hypothetical protein [Candidatus Sericytochromatia bacterium]
MRTEINVLVEEVFYDKNNLIKKIGDVYSNTLSDLREKEIDHKKEVIIDYDGLNCHARMVLKKEENTFSIHGFEHFGNEFIDYNEEKLDFEQAKIIIRKIYENLEAKEQN